MDRAGGHLPAGQCSVWHSHPTERHYWLSDDHWTLYRIAMVLSFAIKEYLGGGVIILVGYLQSVLISSSFHLIFQNPWVIPVKYIISSGVTKFIF